MAHAARDSLDIIGNILPIRIRIGYVSYAQENLQELCECRREIVCMPLLALKHTLEMILRQCHI